MTEVAPHTVLLAIVALLGIAALHDIAFRTVPNRLIAGIAALSLLLRALEHQLAPALLASLLVFVLCIVCWLRGWLGGGDAKLLPASALAVVPAQVPAFVFMVTIAGGVLALVYLALGRLLGRTRIPSDLRDTPRALAPRSTHLLPRVLRAERWRIIHRRSIPYACAIAAGAMTTLAQV